MHAPVDWLFYALRIVEGNRLDQEQNEGNQGSYSDNEGAFVCLSFGEHSAFLQRGGTHFISVRCFLHLAPTDHYDYWQEHA